MFRLFATDENVAEANPFSTISHWLDTTGLSSDDNNNRLDGSHHAGPGGLPGLSDLLDELGQIEDVLAEMEIKTVMGHGNITPANILYNAFDQSVTFTGKHFNYSDY